MAHIQTVLNPNEPYSAETFAREMQEAREHPLGLYEAYWVTQQGSEVVGYANVGQYAGLFHPGRYHAYVQVLPQARKQGIGRALASVLQQHLQQRGAQEVLAGAYAHEPAAPALMGEYGLQEVQRYYDSHLDLDAFDFAAWQGHEASPAGVRVVTLNELRSEKGEKAAHQIYHNVYLATLRDVPAPGQRTPLPLEEFVHRLQTPHFRQNPEAILLALDESGQAVGYSTLLFSEDNPAHWHIGLTSVRREWRRRGLALALKLRGMRVARAQGVYKITTNTESLNVPMRTLNERLGFENDVAYVEYRWGKV